MAKKLTKSNRHLVELIEDLRRARHEHDAPIWRDVANRLSSARKHWPSPSIGHISGTLGEKEVALVPGKVLGDGAARDGVTVAAFGFTAPARSKIEQAGGRALTIRDLLGERPSGTDIRIIH